MASGEKKYGLIDPKKKMTISDVFNNDSDSGDERDVMRKRLQKNAEKGTIKKQTIIDMSRALEQDPTVYQYDEVYDTIKKPEQEATKEVVVKKPKYMDALLKTADKRKKEHERRTERLVQKEREAEGDTFKDKEEFITSSYRQKLEEMKLAEEEEKKMEYIESIMDVTKQQDMGSFYRQLYKETIPDAEGKPADEQANEVTEKVHINTETKEKSNSSSSSSVSSSDSSSSSSDSSSDDEDEKVEVKEEDVEKKEEDGKINEPVKEEAASVDKNVTEAPGTETPVEETIKENDTKLFNNTRKKERTYRQRESSVKRQENEKEPSSKVQSSSSSQRRPDDIRGARRDDRGRDAPSNRGRDRDRDRDRNRRMDDHRQSRNSDRYRTNDRKDPRRQRSRSRNRRDRDDTARHNNTTSDRRRPRDNKSSDDRKERGGKSSGEPQEKRTRQENSVKIENKIKVETATSNGNVDNSDKENKAEEKVDIWKKRTVGAIFDGALQRYLQRKAARGS